MISKMPRYFIDTGLSVNAVVTIVSMRCTNFIWSRSITAAHVASMAISFDTRDRGASAKSDSM